MKEVDHHEGDEPQAVELGEIDALGRSPATATPEIARPGRIRSFADPPPGWVEADRPIARCRPRPARARPAARPGRRRDRAFPDHGPSEPDEPCGVPVAGSRDRWPRRGRPDCRGRRPPRRRMSSSSAGVRQQLEPDQVDRRRPGANQAESPWACAGSAGPASLSSELILPGVPLGLKIGDRHRQEGHVDRLGLENPLQSRRCSHRRCRSQEEPGASGRAGSAIFLGASPAGIAPRRGRRRQDRTRRTAETEAARKAA